MEVAIPSPIRVRCNPAFLNKVLSYRCRNRGNISDMLHHGRNGNRCHDKNRCKIKFRQDKRWKSDNSRRGNAGKFKITDPSGFVKPSPCRTSANTYEITTPRRIGIILNIPFPQILKIMITASATIAMSQFVDALLTADGARLSPIQIMIGRSPPVEGNASHVLHQRTG